MRGLFLMVAAGLALAWLTQSAPAQDQSSIGAGGALYEEHCQVCHGEKLRNPGSSFDLRELRAGERARFDKGVLEGRGQMPPWRGTLEPAEIDLLWAYVRSRAND